MNAVRRLVPFPVLSGIIWLLWIALAQRVSVGQILLGAIVALLVPKLTERFWPDRPVVARPLLIPRLLGVVLFDIVTANIAVARLVLGPVDRLRPSFFEVPLEARDIYLATLLGCIISLTPGTVSVDLDRDRWCLLVHGLDVEDEQDLVRTIKQRYEAPLREILGC
jgi:multicomponent K+:H+ antiporter subunit E